MIRRLGSRDTQVDCLPQATVTLSRPLPPSGSRSPDQRSSKRRTMQNDTECGTRKGEGENRPALRKGWQKGREDAGGTTVGGGDVRKATVPSLLLAEGPIRASGSPHIRVSGDSRFCRDRRLSRGADTPNFRRRRRRLARQMGVTCDRLRRACATLLFSRNRLS